DLYNSKQDFGVHSDSVWDLPEPLLLRTIIVSEALVPYDTVTVEVRSETIQRPVSRERGELLRALVSMKITPPLSTLPNFNSSNLSHIVFTFANLQHARLQNSYIHEARFIHADLKYADLRYTILDSVYFVGGELRYTKLRNSSLNRTVFYMTDLRGADLRGADLSFTNLYGAKTDSTTKISSTANYSVNIAHPGSDVPDSLVNLLSYAAKIGVKIDTVIKR
ncbi:MAG: pentapeptide repeat-containing protein, partial [Bacteroidota bacterium]